MNQDLEGKIVVLTDASSGFGPAAAMAFAGAGASVALGARRLEEVLGVEAACASEGSEVLSKEIDVGDPIDIAELARETVARFGRIDVWINNAGAGAAGRFDVLPLEHHVQVIDTTLLGTLYGSYVALRQFHKQKKGTLINIASVIGEVPAPFDASYAAAEHGVLGLSTALRLELEDEGADARDIHVCTLLPNTHDTLLSQNAEDAFIAALFAVARQPRPETVVGCAGSHVGRRPGRVDAGDPDEGLLEREPVGAGAHGWDESGTGRR